jgi:SAM-dependent methyltransferase
LADRSKKSPMTSSADMPAAQRETHWQSVYASKGEREVSWFQDDPEPSLALIEEIASPSSGIIDIGGGSSHLADGLLKRRFLDLTILDLSSTALSAAKARLSSDEAERVQWIVADVTTWEPSRTYDVWHDRATFHFMVAESDRAAYLFRLTRSLKPGGHAIIATFAPDGPNQCSGLPVRRYGADTLGQTLGVGFQLISSRRHKHVTPWGAAQPFQFSVFRHVPTPTAQ